MTDEPSFPGVYLDETATARQIDGVATSQGAPELGEGSPGTSIPGVPTTSGPQPTESLPVEKGIADDRAGEPVQVSGDTDA